MSADPVPRPNGPVSRAKLRVSRSQLKLMAALAGIVVLAVGASGFVAQRELRERELDRTARSLQAQAALIRELIRGMPLRPEAMARLDAIADRAASAAEARVTLIAPGGEVVGDSDVSLELLPQIENHRERPEIREALAGRVGQSARRSRTVGRELLYLAVPIDAGRGGVVRVAMELSNLESALAGLRRALLVAGGLGLLAAVALSYGMAWLTLRPVREIRRLTTAVADGDLDYRLPRRFQDELGEITRAIDRMAEQLRDRLAETTHEKERLQAVLNSMVEGVLVVDEDMRVVLANQRLRSFLGASGELGGMRLLEVARHAELHAMVREAAATDDPVVRQVSVDHPAERTFRVQAVRIPAGSGPRAGTVVVLHDMTEVSQLDKVRREFVANASHELRTPLTAIQGFSETLLHSDELTNESLRSYVEVIDRHARRLTRLVGDLLQLSETEGREATLEPQEVELAPLLARLVRDCEPEFQAKSIKIVQDVSGDPRVWADPHAVEQIVRNLLDNACQYTEAGGTVTLVTTIDAESVQVQVSDTGVGIPERDLGRIFERFYRVDKARSRAAGGTGLGLSIVKHLVQNLAGEILVESRLGRGSTFSVRLPRARPY